MFDWLQSKKPKRCIACGAQAEWTKDYECYRCGGCGLLWSGEFDWYRDPKSGKWGRTGPKDCLLIVRETKEPSDACLAAGNPSKSRFGPHMRTPARVE